MLRANTNEPIGHASLIFAILAIFIGAFFLINPVFAEEESPATEELTPTTDTIPPFQEQIQEQPDVISTEPTTDEPSANEPSETAVNQIIAEVTEEAVAGEEAPPKEVNEDIGVTPEDLGAIDPKILPDNPLYIFKRLGRGVNLLFTRDPVKRAEKELRYANQQLVEAQKLLENKGDQAAQSVERVIEDAENRLENISEQTEGLERERQKKPERVDRFLDKLADHTLKQQKLLDGLAEQMPDESFVRIREGQENSLEHLGTVLTKVPDGIDDVVERFDRVMEDQKGSEFKDFKNLEILKTLENKVPEEARPAILRAQENTFRRLESNIEQMPEDRRDDLQNYIRHLPGNSTARFEVFDDLRAKPEIRPEFIKQIDLLKSASIEKFEEQYRRFNDFEAREKLIEPMKEGEFSGLRMAEQIQNQLPPEMREQIQRVHKEGIRRFTERFVNDPNALEAADLAQKAMTNPDAIDFSLLQKIRTGLTPDQQQAVLELEQEGRERVAQQFQNQGEEFFDRFIDPNAPQGLRVLEDLRPRLPPQAMVGIERAIQNQRQRIEEHLDELQNPEILERMQEAMEDDPELKQTFETGDPNFFLRLESRREVLEQRGEERRAQMEEQIRPLFENPETPIPEIIPEPIRQRIEMQRERIREFNQPRKEMPFPPPSGNNQGFGAPGRPVESNGENPPEGIMQPLPAEMQPPDNQRRGPIPFAPIRQLERFFNRESSTESNENVPALQEQDFEGSPPRIEDRVPQFQPIPGSSDRGTPNETIPIAPTERAPFMDRNFVPRDVPNIIPNTQLERPAPMQAPQNTPPPPPSNQPN